MPTNKTCPNMTSEAAPNFVITSESINQIQLSTYNKSVGAVVDISCYGKRKLNGVNQTTCQANGTWDYPYVPKCTPIATSTSSSALLTKEQMIIVGVFSGIGALLLIILLAVIIAVCLRKRRQKDQKYKDTSVNSYSSQPAGYRPFSYGYNTNDWPHGKRNSGVYDSMVYPPSRTTRYDYINPAYPRELEAESPSRTTRYDYINPAYPRELEAESPSRTTRYDYINPAYPRELEAESPYRFVHHQNRENEEIYRGIPSSRNEYKDMNYYNRDAEYDGRDPFLWRPEPQRTYYN